MDPHFDGVIFQTYAAELARRMKRPWPRWAVLDVRSRDEYLAGHVPGAFNLTADDLLEHGLPPVIDESTEVFVVGRGPHDPTPVRDATLALRDLGVHRRVEFPGGMSEWESLGYPVEPGDDRERAA